MTVLVPIVGTRSMRLSNLANTVAASATFRQLMGAADEAAALSFIHFNIALDDGSAAYPRCIIRAHGAQTAERRGFSWTGSGQMLVFVQYALAKIKADRDAALEAWYSISGPFSEEDYRRHMDNLFGAIGDEMSAVSNQYPYMEFRRIEEYSCGFLDTVTENGQQLVELCWMLHREGLP